MRIAFINRPKGSWIGGDYVQMESTAEALRKLGVQVDIFETPTPIPVTTLSSYDIIHLWNFTMPWSKIGVWVGKHLNKKIVCSMIYHETSNTTTEEQQIMIDNINLGIFLCPGEVARAEKKIKINCKTAMIPNGISPWWLKPIKHKRQNYVLTVGRIDGTKGQLEVARECKKLGYKYKMVGEAIDNHYLTRCTNYGAEYLGILKGDELKKVYAQCRVFVLKSNTEVMPLTVMEAGALNKPVVLNDKCLFKFPGISDSIESAWEKSDNRELHDFVSKTTWDDVAKLIKEQYEQL